VPPKCAAEFLADHSASLPGTSIPQLGPGGLASSVVLGLRRQTPKRMVRSLIMIGAAERPSASTTQQSAHPHKPSGSRSEGAVQCKLHPPALLPR
jgi:hypothetical protein